MERDAAPMSARMLLNVCSDGLYTVGSEELFLSFTIPRLLAMRLLGVFFITYKEPHVKSRLIRNTVTMTEFAYLSFLIKCDIQ